MILLYTNYYNYLYLWGIFKAKSSENPTNNSVLNNTNIFPM